MTTHTPHQTSQTPTRRRRNPDVYCKIGRSRAAQGGFTLIEILVTISIIALLVGLTAIGATVIRKGASEQRAKSLCQSLLGPQDEFKAQFGQGINLNHDGTAPIDWGGGTFQRNAPGASGTAGGGGLSSSERFVVGCYLFEPSGDALRAAVQGKNALVDLDSDGFLEIRDPWDNEVAYRSSNDQTGSFDGINNNLLPMHRDPLFVSPGRDGDFSTQDDNIDSTEIGS